MIKLVIDTNVLFSFFKKYSFSRKIILSLKFELIAPHLAIAELVKYSKLIIKKSKSSEQEFIEALYWLKQIICFEKKSTYEKFIIQAINLSNNFSVKEIKEFYEDIDFFALALKERCAIWSNDKLFKKQNKIKIFSTKELSLLLN